MLGKKIISVVVGGLGFVEDFGFIFIATEFKNFENF